MEVLKKLLIGSFLLNLSLSASSQEGLVEKAFSESYNQELAKSYDKAIAGLMKVYAPEDYEMNLRLGWLYYLNKNYQIAVNYYQKAIDARPEAIEPKLGIVMPLAFLENVDKLMQQYNDIIKIHPQNTSANYWAGVIYYNRKDYKTAAKYFEKVVSLYPFDYDSNEMLGWSFLNLGKGADAKPYFETALLARPDDTSSLDGLSKIK